LPIRLPGMLDEESEGVRPHGRGLSFVMRQKGEQRVPKFASRSRTGWEEPQQRDWGDRSEKLQKRPFAGEGVSRINLGCFLRKQEDKKLDLKSQREMARSLEGGGRRGNKG